MDLLKYCIDNYEYNEPILTEELRDNLSIKDSTLRMRLKRLVDNGKLKRYAPGIYFIPKSNTLLKNQSMSIDKVIRKKYLLDGESAIGYQTGIAFANKLNLTSQTSGVIEVVTNKETNRKRPTTINNWRIILRKPRTLVKQENIKVLQVLDMLNNFNKFSEKSLKDSLNSIKNYLADVDIDKRELNEILTNYPKDITSKMSESGLFDVLTQR